MLHIKPSIIRLDILNNKIDGMLTDIVPHCKKLRDFTIMIENNLYDSECLKFATLTNLVSLRILGVHESGALNPLIKSLATKNTSTLKTLVVDAAPMDITEIGEVIGIQSLEVFKCRFVNMKCFHLVIHHSKGKALLTFNFEKEIDASDLAFLSNLTRFTSLRINGRHKPGTLKPLFEAISGKESPDLESLTTVKSPKDTRTDMFDSNEILEIFKINSLKTLQCSFSGTLPMDFPTQLPKIYNITIESHNTTSLRNLYKALAQQIPSKLNILTIKGSPLDLEDLLEIIKINSLSELSCGLTDIKVLYYLAQLTQLQELTISSKHKLYKLSKAVSRFYEASKRNVSIYSKDLSIDIYTKELNINMTAYMSSVDMVPLASLPNLSNVTVFGRERRNSLTPLFKALASRQITALQKLEVDVIEGISADEVKEVAQIKTLRYLACGCSDPKSLYLLKQMPNLKSLRITATHNFYNIAKAVLVTPKGCLNELTVTRHGREITYNKKLSKLTILNISYKDEVLNAQEYAPLAQLPQLRSLHIIGRHKFGSFKELFRSLADNKYSTLEEITCSLKIKDKYQEYTKSLAINFEEAIEVSKISSLKTLKCGFTGLNSVELLTKLTNLKDLSIAYYPESSLAKFLQELASRKGCSLQSLTLSGKSLTFEEVARVAEVSSLKKLECALDDNQNVKVLAKLYHLQKLYIRADKCGCLSTLFHALGSLESRTLQQLKIVGRPISYKEMMTIVEIKSLTKLCCVLTDTKSIKGLLQLPELTELSLELYNCYTDCESIDILTQLKKLTDLEIKSPEASSLTGLFKRFSTKEVPILESLVIRENDIDSYEMDAIAQFKSLIRLQCGFNEDEYYECLLNILQKCQELKAVNMHYDNRFVGLDFMAEALRILKGLKKPQGHEALTLHISNFNGWRPEQVALSDDCYLIICRFENEILRKLSLN